MKIVFYNHTGKVSGAERLLLSVLGRLAEGEFAPVVLCPNDGPLAEMVAGLGTPVETVTTLEARFTWRPDQFLHYCRSFYRVIADFRRQVIKLNPDLIHANSIRAGLVATAATPGLKVKVVWHLHDLLPRHPLSCAVRAVAALSGRSRMIAVSEAVSRNFSGYWSWRLRHRIKVILNAIDVTSFSARTSDREACRTGLSLAPDEFAIGIVGQLTPRKGQLELLRAFAKLLDDLPQAVLLVVGAAIFNRDSDYEQMLRATAAKLGIAQRVKMLGSRQDVPEIISALDLLVINSRREPFGLVACEAMACGTPVLATACDGLPEIIKHQRNGWLVAYGDEAEMISAIKFLHARRDVRSELAITAQQNVAQRFSMHRYLNELQTFYYTLHKEGFARQEVASAPGPNQEKEFHPEVI